MTVHVGTSGWAYKDWKGNFYPPELPAREQLAHYARHFGAVEVDSSFYGAPAPATLDHWAEAVPSGFRFALKVPRDITHDRLLKDCAPDLLAFLDLVSRLGPRRGPVILQLPPTFARSRLPDLFRLLEALPVTPGVSVELRHGSCFVTETFEQLRQRGVGLVTTDAHAGLLLSGPDVVLRLLGDRRRVTVFDRVVLDRAKDIEAWAERLTALPAWVRDTWVFVNNHFSGHSPTTAAALAARLGLPSPGGERPGEQRRLFG
jgi:uncharacterized protein YecE (DUF72 family)